MRAVLFKHEYPDCWVDMTSCTKPLIDVVTYMAIAGLILGMVSLGFLADRLGRRKGSRMTASVMLLAVVILTASAGTTIAGQFIMMTVGLTLFGYGVGVRAEFFSLIAA